MVDIVGVLSGTELQHYISIMDTTTNVDNLLDQTHLLTNIMGAGCSLAFYNEALYPIYIYLPC